VKQVSTTGKFAIRHRERQAASRQAASILHFVRLAIVSTYCVLSVDFVFVEFVEFVDFCRLSMPPRHLQLAAQFRNSPVERATFFGF
jgi:hypothetical protein